MDYTNIKHCNKTLNFLTGITSDSLFQWILSFIRSDGPSILKSFTMNSHLLLILIKLKLGASNPDLSLRFNIKEENTTLPVTQVDITDNIMVSIAGIISLNASVVNK